MKRLIIDTSTAIQYLALINGEELIASYQAPLLKNHSHSLLINLNELLKNNNTEIKELDEIICGIGPGSFTGVRIACTVAKVLVYSHGASLKSISSLYLMASGYDGLVIPLIDAKREKFFCAVYQDGKILLEDAIRTKEEVIQGLNDYRYITEENFLVSPKKVIKMATKADCFSLTPNYIKNV
ncbi:MAG: tRNA (adenosine(37)-N6)-threonylcarbamoyltransferase complex dimerization subunit type 1 TsaB [Erysipelotrichales bacterium]|nr:tRNA (adenosine(37)-N6)-threonylcarbamoyltransferase complex dimerization subunit type 1 TsaB [Erysipelotrichales bacterium]